MADNPFQQSGQSVDEYVGGPSLVALGVHLDMETGKISREDQPGVEALDDCHAAIADVMAHAMEMEEKSPGEGHHSVLMDELLDGGYILGSSLAHKPRYQPRRTTNRSSTVGLVLVHGRSRVSRTAWHCLMIPIRCHTGKS